MSEFAQNKKSGFWNKLIKSPKMQPFEWMVKPTPQEQWIDGPGVYLWLAFFFSEIGAGIYFVSLFVNSTAGYILGWLMTLVLGGLIHMRYLGKPARAFRIFMRPQNSELSRGMWVILIFAILGFFQILPGIFPGLPWTGNHVIYKVIMGLILILLIMHGFATMNVVRAIPSWNSSVILPFSVISGIWVGSQFVELILGFSGTSLVVFENWSLVMLLTYIFTVALYLWGTVHEDETAKFSIKDMVKGHYSRLFYLVVIIGMLIPLLITLASYGEDINVGLVLLRLIFVFIGDMLLRYNIMKSAYYPPLI